MTFHTSAFVHSLPRSLRLNRLKLVAAYVSHGTLGRNLSVCPFLFKLHFFFRLQEDNKKKELRDGGGGGALIQESVLSVNN